jgi:hypothetical protein
VITGIDRTAKAGFENLDEKLGKKAFASAQWEAKVKASRHGLSGEACCAPGLLKDRVTNVAR